MNIERLIEMVNDYFSAEEDFRIFLKSWVPGWFPSKTPEEQVAYTKHSERSTERYNAVMAVCTIIGVDPEGLFAIVKAINRYNKNHGKYDRWLHFSYRDQAKFFISIEDNGCDSGHYYSTGRKIAA